MKSKVFKFIFIVSFIPYILILIGGINGAVNGAEFFFSTSYGLDGFIIDMIAINLAMFNVPIIPICIVIEIAYCIRNIVLKKISMKKYIVIILVVCALIAALICADGFFFSVERYLEEKAAKEMIVQADERIVYDESTIVSGGIFDIPGYERNTILIDLDKHEVGFLLYGSMDEFWNIELDSDDSEQIAHIKQNYYLQADIPLDNAGRLLTFYSAPDLVHRTVAIILVNAGGSIYYADNIVEKGTNYEPYTALNRSGFFVGENVKYHSYKIIQ